MKRSECSIEKLKSLGYVARHSICASWFNPGRVIDCHGKHSQEVFEAVVKAAKTGCDVEIERNDYLHTVNVYVKELDFTETRLRDRFFLSRPMTEAERLEADLRTGRGKEWVIYNAE